MMHLRTFLTTAALGAVAVITQAAEPVKTQPAPAPAASKIKTETVVVGGGCFWCTEAIFQRLDGVQKVVSGYSGGHVKNPTYEEVCTKQTGHAEVIKIEFDPAKAPLSKVLDVFFLAHDPTTLNRQGNDAGPQYRSVIYYANDEQKKAAEAAKERAKAEYKDPIVTEVAPLKEFYAAEGYHQNYFNLNKDSNPYCHLISYKLRKLLDKGVISDPGK
jgi:peptide-methionine (S)-S-oxide reductase